MWLAWYTLTHLHTIQENVSDTRDTYWDFNLIGYNRTGGLIQDFRHNDRHALSAILV